MVESFHILLHMYYMCRVRGGADIVSFVSVSAVLFSFSFPFPFAFVSIFVFIVVRVSVALIFVFVFALFARFTFRGLLVNHFIRIHRSVAA